MPLDGSYPANQPYRIGRRDWDGGVDAKRQRRGHLRQSAI
jgi:hypothetical protein